MGNSPWGFKSPLAHNVFPRDLSPRRRRRRRRLVVPLVAALLLLVLWAATSIRSDTRALVEFFDTAQLQAEEQAAAAASLQAALGDLRDGDRDMLLTRLQSIHAGLDESIAAMEAVDVPPDGIGAAHLFDLALDQWQLGVEAFEPALLAVVDEPQSERAVEELGAALQELRVGDLVYLRFLSESAPLWPELDVETPPSFPEVAMVPATLTLSQAPTRIAVLARANPDLRLRADLRLSQVSFEPADVVNPDGDRVVPATDTLAVTVVVENAGNGDEESRSLTARLESEGTVVAVEQMQTEALAPGSSTTLSFPAFAVMEGSSYRLELRLSIVEQEVDVENNLAVIPFIVNARP